MKKPLLLMACLSIFALALTACAKDKIFSGGTEMSAEELRLYREHLLAQKEEPEAPEEPAVPEAEEVVDSEEILQVCYYTASGTVWHADRNCSYLKRSQSVLEGSVESAALAGKNRPCSSCAAVYIKD